MIIKRKGILIACLIFLFLFVSALVIIFIENRANTANSLYDSCEAGGGVLNTFSAGALNGGETTASYSSDSIGLTPTVQYWIFSFSALFGIFLGWRIYTLKRMGSLKRRTRRIMINEQFEYYGIDERSNSVFKRKASYFTDKEVRERIKYDIERRREERRRLRERGSRDMF